MTGSALDAATPGPRKAPSRRYAATLLACIVATAVAALLAAYFEIVNIVMVFMLTVVLVGRQWGRGPAVAAAVLNVLLFDFLFVQPRFSLSVSDAQFLLTFAVMLAVGLITGQLTGGLREQADLARRREARARTLYEFARDLSAVLTTAQVIDTGEAFMSRAFGARVEIMPAPGGRLGETARRRVGNPLDHAAAQWVYEHGQPAGAGTRTLPANDWLFLPLKAPMRTRGILAIGAHRMRGIVPPEQMREYETFAALTAIALERVHYVEVARDALIRIESERLRNSLLATLSHDLRTPLAALLGLAEAMPLTRPPLSAEQVDMAHGVAEEARRLIALVNNLLDMARMQSGEVRLDLQWHSLEELVGSAIAASRAGLGARAVAVDIPRELPLVQMDGVLIERVLVNLLENAGKYTPPGARICIAARALEGELELTVADDGPGIQSGQEEAVFAKFVRGDPEGATAGVGLGLAICRAIVEAHHGTIRAEAAQPHGARFVIRFPRGEAPEVKLT